MARYPVPSHILDKIDESDLSSYGSAHVARRTENRRMIAGATEKINTIFEAGAPFFTKDAIRDIVRQLDELTANIRLGDKALLTFTLQGLDGSFVNIPLALGEVLPYRDLPDVDIIYAKVLVRFRPIDHLTSMTRRFSDEFQLSHAFLPMIVERRPVQLHSLTKDYVPQYPLLPLQEVQRIFQQKRMEWETSGPGRQLVSTLRSTTIPRVKKIILAFACFNMSDCEMAERSACQHVLILALRTFFAESQQMADKDILCFAQDPLYENIDERILTDAGITVLENPRAFLEVDDASVVFTLSPETPVRQIIADIARPAVMIWNRVEEVELTPEWKGQTECEDNISPRVEEMIRKHYTELEFPVDIYHFGANLTIYVRKLGSLPEATY